MNDYDVTGIDQSEDPLTLFAFLIGSDTTDTELRKKNRKIERDELE